MAFDGVLFDLDGTLWDSSRTVQKSWVLAAEDFRPGLGKAITLEAIHRNMGKVLPVFFADIFPDLPHQKREALMAACGEREMEVVAREGGILYPGLEETLARLSRVCPLFIVSNCQHGYIDAFYAAHGLGHYFTDMEYAARTGKSKGENIALVVRRHGLKRPIYIGDTQGDLDAAAQAGIPFIHATYGFGTVRETVPQLEHIADLPQVLEELERYCS